MTAIETKMSGGRPLSVYGVELASRLLLGTAQYPSPQVLREAVKASRAGVVTVALRRESARVKAGQRFWEIIQDLGVRVLPNTAGCRTPKEAGKTPHIGRGFFRPPRGKPQVLAKKDTPPP